MKADDGKRCTYVSYPTFRQQAAGTKLESLNWAVDALIAPIYIIHFPVSRCSRLRQPGSSTAWGGTDKETAGMPS